jgi:hypothetical protein
MKFMFLSFAFAVLSLGGGSCAQPPKQLAATKAAPAGSRFEEIGRVTMHSGQPCTSQIMFDFRADHSKRLIWLSAPVQETKVLTEAVQRRRRIRVSGNWRHGKENGCSYVHVIRVETAPTHFLFF